jgi:hypothetical protein
VTNFAYGRVNKAWISVPWIFQWTSAPVLLVDYDCDRWANEESKVSLKNKKNCDEVGTGLHLISYWPFTLEWLLICLPNAGKRKCSAYLHIDQWMQGALERSGDPHWARWQGLSAEGKSWTDFQLRAICAKTQQLGKCLSPSWMWGSGRNTILAIRVTIFAKLHIIICISMSEEIEEMLLRMEKIFCITYPII